MLQRLWLRLRSRSVSLSTKILFLILVAVVASLSLTGWLIFRTMSQRSLEVLSQSLIDIASSSSLVFDAKQLKTIQGPEDKAKPGYQNARRALAELWKKNHLGSEDHWGRVRVLRLDLATQKIKVLVSLDGKPIEMAAAPQAIEAVIRNEAVSEKTPGHDWMSAFAPIPGGTTSQGVDLVVVELSAAGLLWDELKILGQILVASLAGLVLALLGAWLLTREITKPMRAFVDVMRLMRNTGDFDIKIDVHPEDRDMSVVEETFTSLIGRVREARDKEQKSYWATLQALVAALDVRDNETAGHSVRVTRYALAVAERLRVNDLVQDQVRLGSLLHDIGKIGVPDAILRKASKLTPEEWKEMQKHPIIGREFLAGIEFLKPATAVVYCHHERWDGKGYPGGISGDAIPLAARIFAVADALDTITSDRYYKKARPFREAREEIERSSDSHFDPAIVKAFMSIPERVFLRIRLEANQSMDEMGPAPRTLR